jgi:hypothetical protein
MDVDNNESAIYFSVSHANVRRNRSIGLLSLTDFGSWEVEDALWVGRAE